MESFTEALLTLVDDGELRDEIVPKNIIMIGPTGVGKTEISRRLADLAGAPFLKVEASKFTEVGYVGRDVESMVRDLLQLAINMVSKEEEENVTAAAAAAAEERLLDLLLPPTPKHDPPKNGTNGTDTPSGQDNVIPLSIMRSKNFAKDYGVLPLYHVKRQGY